MKTLSITLVVLGLAVILSWVFEWYWLTTVGFAAMKPVTAFCFVLAGLMFLTFKNKEHPSQIMCGWACINIFGITISVLACAMSNISLNSKIISNLEIASRFSELPNEPSLMSCICFAIIAIDTFVRMCERKLKYVPTILISVASIGLVGYIFGIEALTYRWEGVSSAMAGHSSLGFLISGYILRKVDNGSN